jgi:hypothetical protein
MSEESLLDKKIEVLEKINLEAELEKMGIKFKGDTSSSGWRSCLNPYKPERNASAGIFFGSGKHRGSLKMFNLAGTRYTTFPFLNLAKDFIPGFRVLEYWDILKYYAKETGVSLNGGKAKEPPSPEKVEYFRKFLTNEVRQYLREKRGLNDDSIVKYEIGWSVKRERLAFPVYDKDGELVNIRFHAWKKDQKPKTLNSTGFGKKRLWGIDRLVKAPDDATVIITEGEFDAMLAEQETGLVSVSPTNGTQGFDLDWIQYFKGKHVVLVWDCDKEGRESVAKTVIPAFKTAIRNGEVKSIRAVWLFKNDDDKQQKDFTDFIVKAGGSGADVLKMIEVTAPENFQLPTTDLPDAIPLGSFVEIDNPAYVGKRVVTDIYIYAENSIAYHVPSAVEVLECQGRIKMGCSGRSDWDWSCDEPIQIRQGSRIQLAAVGANDLQLDLHLSKYVCDKGQKPILKVDDDNKITIRESYAHQVVSGVSSVASAELVEKRIYTIGPEIYRIGQYRATGFVQTHSRHQQPTMIIDTMERQDEDWQGFKLTDETKKLLCDMQKLDILVGDFTQNGMTNEFVQDLVYNVTRIYERYDLHMGVLLSLCSPRWINFPGEGKIRGWVSTVIIGDTGTGKSKVSEEIFKFANIGYRVSGGSASRTGLTYSVEQNDKVGWRVKAGAHVKMSGQALIVDEAQDLADVELKNMADSLDSGRLQVERVASKVFEAETRVIFVCNPRDPHKKHDQKTIGSYQYGCLCLSDIFTKMMLRRVDMVITAASLDIRKEDKDKVYNMVPPDNYKPVISEKHLRSLIFYAWNLNPDQIIISKPIAKMIREESLKLSNIFGQCEDLPIVYPGDFRKTFARLCASLAILDLSSKDDFQTITVKKDHIYFMSDFLQRCYSNKNCQLDNYSKKYARENVLSEEDLIYDRLKKELDNNPERYRYMSIIVGELLNLTPDGREKLSYANIKDLLEKDLDKSTILKLIKPWKDQKLIKSNRGYLPTPKLFQFKHWLLENHPDFLNLEK